MAPYFGSINMQSSSCLYKNVNLTLYICQQKWTWGLTPLFTLFSLHKILEQYCHMPQFMTCLTNSYFKASSYSASSETPHVLWIPKIHCHVLSSLLLVPILSQMSPVLTLTSFFFKILINHFLPSMPRSVQVFSSCQVSPPKSSMYISSSHTYHKPCPSHPPHCYHNFWLADR